MKPTNSRLVAVLAVLSLFGFGCGPQIVRVPPAPTGQTPPPQTQDAIDTTKPLAYLDLSGGAATVTRGGSTVAAQDDTQLVAGDEVRVSSGTTSLVYPGAGESQLDAGADVTLIADGPDTGDVFTELRVTTGEVWTRFERLLGANEHFSVEANGVVATVRGTGFGVDAEGNTVSILVAEHFVDVTTEDEESSASAYPADAMQMDAGHEMTVHAADFQNMDAAGRRAQVKAMSAADRQQPGFTFAATPIPLAKLVRPLHPVLLPPAPTTLPAPLLQRMQTIKRLMTVTPTTPGFAAPTRTLQSGETAPEGAAPTSTGPTSLELDSQATFTVK
ncbi:MAG: FecR domain-containing protein [Patescibacteria group bacterium]